MKTTTAQMSVRRAFHQPATTLHLPMGTIIKVPAKTIWSSTCKTCLTTYETHTHQAAMAKATWHLAHMQPCQRLDKPLTIHDCTEADDDHPLLPSL
ncbi:MAG TPA: hypothetical protein H9821_04805 [Candidatus Rothia avicola]|uniref:Uncharacterized protein n=1 Tax=Candidatus Rothia avicola TaxID=2840478 RepID=A0A9D1ZSG0_9MICC|nr:hypothetical protein [Candidatus Rothia avicola]